MRHDRGVVEQALDAPEALGEGEDARGRREAPRRLDSVELERDHAAEAPHLPPRGLVAGVPGQPGTDDALHARVRGEPRGDRARVVAVALHPDGERLDAAEHEPAVERPGHGPHVLEEAKRLGGVVVRRDAPADHVAVAAEVLRRAVDDEVGAELERRWRYGVANVLSTARARRPFRAAATAATSLTWSSGFVGDSNQTSFVGLQRLHDGGEVRRVDDREAEPPPLETCFTRRYVPP